MPCVNEYSEQGVRKQKICPMYFKICQTYFRAVHLPGFECQRHALRNVCFPSPGSVKNASKRAAHNCRNVKHTRPAPPAFKKGG